mgnify:FL=1
MMFTEQTKSKQKGELNMTFGELLKVVDKSTRIQVCINMYGLDFKANRYKEYLKEDEAEVLLDKKIGTIRTITDEEISTLQVILYF